MNSLSAIILIAFFQHATEAAPTFDFDILYSESKETLLERLTGRVTKHLDDIDKSNKEFTTESEALNNQITTLSDREDEVLDYIITKLKEFQDDIRDMKDSKQCIDEKKEATKTLEDWQKQDGTEQKLKSLVKACIDSFQSDRNAEKVEEKYKKVIQVHSTEKSKLAALVSSCSKYPENYKIIACVGIGIQSFYSAWKNAEAAIDEWKTSKNTIIEALGEATKCLQAVEDNENIKKVQEKINVYKKCVKEEEQNPSSQNENSKDDKNGSSGKEDNGTKPGNQSEDYEDDKWGSSGKESDNEGKGNDSLE